MSSAAGALTAPYASLPVLTTGTGNQSAAPNGQGPASPPPLGRDSFKPVSEMPLLMPLPSTDGTTSSPSNGKDRTARDVVGTQNIGVLAIVIAAIIGASGTFIGIPTVVEARGIRQRLQHELAVKHFASEAKARTRDGQAWHTAFERLDGELRGTAVASAAIALGDRSFARTELSRKLSALPSAAEDKLSVTLQRRAFILRHVRNQLGRLEATTNADDQAAREVLEAFSAHLAFDSESKPKNNDDILQLYRDHAPDRTSPVNHAQVARFNAWLDALWHEASEANIAHGKSLSIAYPAVEKAPGRRQDIRVLDSQSAIDAYGAELASAKAPVLSEDLSVYDAQRDPILAGHIKKAASGRTVRGSDHFRIFKRYALPAIERFDAPMPGRGIVVAVQYLGSKADAKLPKGYNPVNHFEAWQANPRLLHTKGVKQFRLRFTNRMKSYKNGNGIGLADPNAMGKISANLVVTSLTLSFGAYGTLEAADYFVTEHQIKKNKQRKQQQAAGTAAAAA